MQDFTCQTSQTTWFWKKQNKTLASTKHTYYVFEWRFLLKQVTEKEDSATRQRPVFCALQTRKLPPQCLHALWQHRGARKSNRRVVSAVCLYWRGLTSGSITGRGPEVVTTLWCGGFDVRSMTQHRVLWRWNRALWFYHATSWMMMISLKMRFKRVTRLCCSSLHFGVTDSGKMFAVWYYIS